LRLTAANAENAVEGGNTDDTDGRMRTDVKVRPESSSFGVLNHRRHISHTRRNIRKMQVRLTAANAENAVPYSSN
jgi:hypothetical protein